MAASRGLMEEEAEKGAVECEQCGLGISVLEASAV